MNEIFSSGWFMVLGELIVVDLLLGGDNALLIALACRDLPAAMRHKAMMVGVLGGLLARLGLSFVASMLIDVPTLRMIGGLMLAAIAVNLAMPQREDDHATPFDASAQVFGVGLVIVASDLVMSLDNVVALAAITRGDFLLLTLGLLFSIPALMFGAVLMTKLIKSQPWMIQAGAALLGWIAGDFAVSDSLYAGWIATQSPALIYAAPAAMAVYVVIQAKLLARAPQPAASAKPAKVAASVKRVAPLAVPKPAPEPALPKPLAEPEPPAEESRGPEKYTIYIFAALFLIIAVMLAVVIVIGDGDI